ncbi:hypothetical protein [Streptococcus lactarius]|uniref:hypothetical protein n=1 Tax=Streptococcus lactarius TaxID=684066 RepID=UPI003617012F
MTDDDISKAKIVGDFKKLFAKLMDQTVSLTEEAGTSVTGVDKESYDATVSALKQEMENQKKSLTKHWKTLVQIVLSFPKKTVKI